MSNIKISREFRSKIRNYFIGEMEQNGLMIKKKVYMVLNLIEHLLI